jgi:phage-related protein
MSTRAYDYILQVADASSFEVGNIVIGASSNAISEIVSIESSNLKVRLANNYLEYLQGETLISNVSTLYSINTFIDHSSNVNGTNNVFALPITLGLSDSVIVYVDSLLASRDSFTIHANSTIQFLPILQRENANSEILTATVFPTTNVTSLLVQVVVGNVEALSFVASNLTGYVETANSTITSIYNSPYIAEKNSSQQTPLVKLYSIYYPGEWYPKDEFGNPGKTGSGYPWPYGFPIRFAEVIGENYSDFNYAVIYDNQEYKVTALESGAISTDSSGRVGESTLKIANFDGYIAGLVENPNIAGYNSSNATVAFVNGTVVQNIDPRTVAPNVHYDASVAAERGANAAWDYESTIAHGDTWTPFKLDSRDLLEAVVEIKLTYAKFLDYWPEYSLVKNSTSNSLTVYSAGPYRIGDSVTSNTDSSISTIEAIYGNTLYLSDSNLGDLLANSKVLILNPEADRNSHIEHVFTITRLEELDELSASFSLSNWLQYFKKSIPKRKFYTTTCPFQYKDNNCKYPSNGTGTIVGSRPPLQANGFFTLNNATAGSISQDICAKTITACKLRRNSINFGGFPGADS